MLSALFSVSTRPAALTAVTRVDSAGLLLAAVATGSCDMPSNEPLPEVGTAAQPAPKGALASLAEDEADGVAAALEEGAAALDDGAAAALDAGAEPVAAVSPQAARLRGNATTAARAAILVAEDLKFMIGLSGREVQGFSVGPTVLTSPVRHGRRGDWSRINQFLTRANGCGHAEEPPGGGSGPSSRYSLVNWIWCQPRAPSGKTLVRASGWVAPVASVARTVALCSPAGPVKGIDHWRHRSRPASVARSASCQGPSSILTSTFWMPRCCAQATPAMTGLSLRDRAERLRQVDPALRQDRAVGGPLALGPVGRALGVRRELDPLEPLGVGHEAEQARHDHAGRVAAGVGQRLRRPGPTAIMASRPSLTAWIGRGGGVARVERVRVDLVDARPARRPARGSR